MRVLLVCLLACLHIVHSQTYPLLRHNELTFQSNSFIDRGIVSVADKLECVTNYTPCCVGTDGGWTDPAGVAIQEGSGGTIPFYVTRTAAGTIYLNRLAVSNGQEQLSGMYECEIPGSGGTPEMMFIYLGNQSTGKSEKQGEREAFQWQNEGFQRLNQVFNQRFLRVNQLLRGERPVPVLIL